MGNIEESTIRASHSAEPQHDGREAIRDTEEARPHPAADWARFQRVCCIRCNC